MNSRTIELDESIRHHISIGLLCGKGAASNTASGYGWRFLSEYVRLLVKNGVRIDDVQVKWWGRWTIYYSMP